VTIQFSEDGRVSGNGGCNHYSGPAKLEKGEVTIGPSPRPCACAAEVMDRKRLSRSAGNTSGWSSRDRTC
jgi:heat shock protein HslJ